MDDVVTGLEGRGVVSGVAAQAEEKRWGFVLVFPYGLFEVFTCRCMVGAHLGELEKCLRSMSLNHLGGWRQMKAEGLRAQAKGRKPL